jgi:hypothetical protein
MNNTFTKAWGLRAGIAIVSVVFLQLFFIGAFSLAHAEDALPETTETVVVEEPAAPEDTSSVADILEETFAPVVEAITGPDEETTPVVEEAPPVVEEPVVVEEQPVVEEPVVEPVLAPEISSDKSDYFPWEKVTIFGHLFEALKSIVVTITGGTGTTYMQFVQTVITDENGNFTAIQPLDNVFRPDYTATASDEDGNVLAETTFTDANPATDISQCQNGGIGDVLQPCSETAPNAAASGYGYEGNANANGSNSHWFEGDFVPLRIVATNFAPGAGYIDFSIDVTKGGKHAYDYIGDYDATEKTGAPDSAHANQNNPCGDIVAGCSPTAPNSVGSVPGATLSSFPVACGSNTFTGTQTAGNIKGWGTSGALTVSYVTQNVGSSDCTTRIRVAWTATQPSFGGTIVLAYGAHIAKQSDWGAGNSAISISGSPYHTSLVERSTGGDVKGIGSQDAKLSANAVQVPNTITIHKVMVGGTDTFTFTGSPNGTINTNNGTLSASPPNGAGSVTESALAGWALTNLTCTTPTGGATATPDLAARTVNYTMPTGGGGSVDCTFTNTKSTKLTVTKVVINDNGGTKVVGDFPLFVDGGSVTSGVQNNQTVGAHTVSETGDANYTATISGDCAADGTITLAAGDVKACTITNNDNAPKLTLNKIVVNNNGGNAAESDWNLTATGPTTISGAGASGSTDVVSGATFAAGSYVLSESTGPSGYTPSGWACSNGDNDGTITVALGDDITCSITNDDQAAHIILIKNVINNNGGGATANNFGLTVAGGPVLSGASTQVDSNTPIALNEAGLAGYAFVSLTGTNCPSVLGGTATLNEGQTITCTITNDDIAPTLTLVKTVTNDNGGTADVDDFQGRIDGGNVPWAAAQTSSAGLHTASETNLPGYTATSWGGDCAADGSITLTLGQNATCTITNNDDAPSLTLVKVVTNNNGGTAVASSVTLTATGPTGFSGAGPTVNNGASFDAGTYNLSETSLPGYAASAWVCVGGTQDDSDTVTLGLGQSATCTITNNDIAPSLTLVKVVDNQFGGTAVAANWTLTATGPTTISGAGGTASGPTFSAGAYTLSESAGPSGYTPGTWLCTGDVTNTGNQITLGLGQTASCTIVNHDVAPQLTVIKHVINDNGGTADADDFTMNVTATQPSDDSFAGSEAGTTITLDAGSYSVDESAFAGYAKTLSADCTGTIAVGQTKTCTITNNDISPTLTVIKVLNPANDTGLFNLQIDGSTAGTGGNVGNNGTTGAVPVNVGAHAVSEAAGTATNLSDYDSAITGDCATNGSVTLALAENKTCTITNTKKSHLIVQKTTLPAGDTTVFSINATGSGTITGGGAGTVTDALDKDYTVTAGTYSVAETVPSGWTKTGDTCQNVVVGVGQTVTCLITNTKVGKITIVKDSQPNDCQDFSFTMTGQTSFLLDDNDGVTDCTDTNQAQSKPFINLIPGSFVVTEAAVNQFWKLNAVNCTNAGGAPVSTFVTSATGVTITLTPGGDVTCTFVNEKLAPTRTIGFWQTHTTFTSSKFTTVLGSNMPIGVAPHKGSITTVNQLFGGFYASIPKTTTGAKRTELDKARIQMLQQLIAAKLNCATFGCPASVVTLIAQADAAYAGSSASAINSLTGQLDAYNNSGDTIIAANAGKATPKDSQSLANFTFWDLP